MSIFINLRIQRAVAHKIFKRTPLGAPVPSETPSYSTSLLNLDNEALTTLQDRISKSLLNKFCLPLTAEKTETDSVYGIAKKMLKASVGDFLSLSEMITRKLWESQSAANIPGGVIVIAEISIGHPSKRAILVAKAEQDIGFSADTNNTVINLSYLKDLLFTDSQKLYKVAIFIEQDGDLFDVYAADSQIRISQGVLNTNFFVSQFLGCKVSETSQVQTKTFYDQANQVISNLSLSAEDHLGLSSSIHSYLESNTPIIDVNSFADTYIQDPKTRDSFTQEMLKVLPIGIAKDINLVAPSLKKQGVIFENDIKLTGPSETFYNAVSIIEDENSVTIKITGKIKGFKS